MAQDAETRPASADRLTAIQDQTRETLELVRSLVQLLAPREGARKGPPLEDLIAALVAQQRAMLFSVRDLQAGMDALCEHLLGEDRPARMRARRTNGGARA